MTCPQRCLSYSLLQAVLLGFLAQSLPAQVLINVDFGAGSQSRKVGMAAFGQTTNDFWNLYRHYDPRYVPGSPLVYDGELAGLKMADGSETSIRLSVSNAPGVWGNMSGDPMYDTYVFARDGSNLVARIQGLARGRYHFYLYGHADADVTGEQNSVFDLRSGTNRLGPISTAPAAAWKAGDLWREGSQYVVFRDVPVEGDQPVVITVGAGAGGVAVLNGLQISSRGTSPPAWSRLAVAPQDSRWTNLLVHAVAYDGQVTPQDARFKVNLDVESKTTNEVSTILFQGDLAIQTESLPGELSLVASNAQFRLITRGMGRHQLQLELVSKVRRDAPWYQTAFTGPPAAIATLTAQSADPRLELELVQGIPETGATGIGPATNSSIKGLVGSDGLVSLRWRNRQESAARQAWIGVETAVSARITPAVIRYRAQFDYSILQGSVSNLSLVVPTNQTVTRLEGEQIRDWQMTDEKGRQVLRIDLLQGRNQAYRLVVHSEQPLEAQASVVSLLAAEPQNVSREAGSLSIGAEDMQADIQSAAGLRRINAPAEALAAYRFSGRPFALTASLRPVEPVLRAAHRLRTRLEESRWLLRDYLEVSVEKAGIYSLETRLPSGFTVTEVKGEGVSEWSATNQVLRISLAGRLAGARSFEVQLEQPFKALPDQLSLTALSLERSQGETARIGVSTVAGLMVKTRELVGLREIPVNTLPDASDAVLAYELTQADWRLALSTTRLSPRVVAEVFNLVTIGEGLAGGSATVRLGIVNQGIQELRLRLPENWKNLEFTGPNIRRKEKKGEDWVIGLQDKAWGGYTLVITYDFPFDGAGALISLGGAHALGVERETGSLAIVSTGGLQVEPQEVSAALRRIDESEIGMADRAVITRPVLLAWRYEGPNFNLRVQARRFEPLPVLEAVADRTQITTVINPEGQTLTQASFRVKNNEKQFQRFRLPAGAEFWSCFVNGLPVKAEKDGEWILAPLPRQTNRDQAFAVELVYAQKLASLNSWRPARLELVSPGTDVPNTYAEWQVFLPATHRLAKMSGNMTVARGTLYDWREAWGRFISFYAGLWRENGEFIAALAILAILVIALLVGWRRQGLRGAWGVVVLFAILAVLAGMLLPAMSKARPKARSIALHERQEEQVLAEALNRSGQALDKIEGAQVTTSTGDEIRRRGLTATRPGNQPAPLAAARRDMPESMLKRYGLQSAAPEQRAAGLGGGGVAGAQIGDNFSTAPAVPPPVALPPAEPMMAGRRNVIAEGIRPIHIDIPQSGQVVTFTKTLNTDGQPLAVQARVVKQSAQVVIRSILQAAVFLAGLLLIRRGRKSPSTSAAWTALGFLLVLGSVGHWLMSWKWLHLGLILAAPLLGLLLAGLLVAALWRSASHARTAAALFLAGFIAFQGEHKVQAETPGIEKLATNSVSILAASYQGKVTEQVAQIKATVNLLSSLTNQFVPLFQGEVALSTFQAAPASATLMRQGSWIGVYLPEEGSVRVEIELAARVRGDASRRQLSLPIPAALASHFDLRLPGAETEVDMPAAVLFKKTTQDGETRVEATAGPVSRLELQWAPRTKQAAETAATVFCQNSSRIRFGLSALQIRSVLDYQVSQGEARELRVRLPASTRLLRVEGEGIQSWNQTEQSGLPLIVVELAKAVTGNYRLVLETERDLVLPATLPVQLPSAVDMRRETGILALQAEDEMGVTVLTNTTARAETSDFEQASGAKLEGSAQVFRFLRPDFKLTVLAAALQPEVEAQVRQACRVGFEQTRLSAQIDYQVKRAGLFLLRLRLPDGYRVEAVTGDKVLSWTERSETNRVLEVTLKERTLGACSVQVDLARNYSDPPPELTLTGVVPLGATKTSGSVSVTAETGLVLKTTTFDGLVEIPAATLSLSPRNIDNTTAKAASSQSALAFKTTPGTADTGAGWTLVLAIERVEAWLRSEIAHSYQIEETLLTGRAVIRYEIANAPVKRFRLVTPPSMAHVEFTGDNIRRRDQQGQEWQIELQNKVSGIYYLGLQWDQPLTSLTNQLALAGVQTRDVERETGFIAILARPPFQIVDQAASNLVKIDPLELPDWSGISNAQIAPSGQAQSVVRAYRYLKPAYDLRIQVKRYEEAGVLQALVDQAQLTTVQAEDGQWITQAVLEIRNNGRQHLDLRLPAQAELWSAFVAGQPVQPVRLTSSVLLPLERSGSDGSPVRVELTLTGRRAAPLHRGTLEWASPLLDLPIKKARWDLYLPFDFRYDHFAGSMRLEEPGYRAESIQYTERDYSEQESRAKVSQQSEVNLDLSNIRRSLAEGKVKEAAERFSQARQKDVYFNTANSDLKKVERELRQAQGSNLIQAQNAFSFQTMNGQAALPGLNLGNENNQVAVLPNGSVYEAEIAEQQWAKLQQAQDVAAARRQPLRVNLPTRGLHYAFVQVLQTDQDTPMTISMKAVSLRQGGWFSRILFWGGLFLVLWLLAARLRPERQALRE